MSGWAEDNEWERGWWGDCLITFGEENKQLLYAARMGLVIAPDPDEKWPKYDLGGRSVVDIGGGPVSILLKCVNGGRLTVVDPCRFPNWVEARYEAAGIDWQVIPAEEWDGEGYDEAWLYNVLQHTMDPERIVANARRAASVVRVFEFPYTAPHTGHPQTLMPAQMDEWLGGEGAVEVVNENGIHGLVYHGVFPGLKP